jgi:hypothetical protein
MKMKKTSNKPLNRNILGLVLTSNRADLYNREECDNSIYYQMMLVRCHPRFTREIETIRKELGIKLIQYPNSGSMTVTTSPFLDFGMEMNQKILKRVVVLAEKYYLRDNWFDALMTYVVSDVLPIPSKDNAIELRPYNEGPSGLVDVKSFGIHLELNDELELGEAIIRYYKQLLKYPRIQITQKLTSKNQLKKWVDENWDQLIEPELRKMNSNIKPAASIERLALGLWLWELRDLKKKSWDQIDDEIDIIEASDPDFFGTDENTMITPDRAKGPDLIYTAKTKLGEFFPL